MITKEEYKQAVYIVDKYKKIIQQYKKENERIVLNNINNDYALFDDTFYCARFDKVEYVFNGYYDFMEFVRCVLSEKQYNSFIKVDTKRKFKINRKLFYENISKYKTRIN